MSRRVGIGSLKLLSLFASRNPSTALATCFTQHLLKTALNGLLRLRSIGWHFKVQPDGINRMSELLSNN